MAEVFLFSLLDAEIPEGRSLLLLFPEITTDCSTTVSGVLDRACSGLRELTVSISSQPGIQRRHIGSFKACVVGVFTLWKLADTTNQAFP